MSCHSKNYVQNISWLFNPASDGTICHPILEKLARNWKSSSCKNGKWTKIQSFVEITKLYPKQDDDDGPGQADSGGQSTDPFSAEQDKRTDEAGGRDTTGQIAFSGVSITIISITIVSITIFTTISMLIINTILTIVNSVKSIPISILNHRCCLFNHNCCLLSMSTKTRFT